MMRSSKAGAHFSASSPLARGEFRGTRQRVGVLSSFSRWRDKAPEGRMRVAVADTGSLTRAPPSPGAARQPLPPPGEAEAASGGLQRTVVMWQRCGSSAPYAHLYLLHQDAAAVKDVVDLAVLVAHERRFEVVFRHEEAGLCARH